ncbi:MAG: hypothetical protein ABSD53_10385 [Terriglobales bacterium]|jgi:hypothetical protein
MPLVRQITAAMCLVLLIFSLTLRAADFTPNDLVAKHLQAIGSAAARSNVKSRVVQSGVTYRVLQGGSGAVDGKSVFASEGQNTNLLLKINANGFHGEQFICDGKKTSVAGTYSDMTRSEFGNFVLAQDVVLRENLLGGIWSVDWPLYDVADRKAKLHAEGTKKIDGKELLALRYQPKKNTDLDIFLYFDPQTFQHIMTIYDLNPSTSMAGGETAQAGKSNRHYRVEERFSDFRSADGLTLPNHYDLRYTIETERGFTKSIEWEVKALNISNNISIDPRSFQVK